MNYKIPLNVCTYGEEEIEAVNRVMRSTHVTMGENCRQFEIEFAEKLGVKDAIFVNSGSSANLLTWFSLANPHFGWFKSPGWEVLVPAVSWSTTYWPIIQAGGVPVLVDSDPETLQMDIDSMRRAIKTGTRAICPVHVLGNAVDMVGVLGLAKDYGLVIVEDTCEALGTRYAGAPVGTFGTAGTFSFYFSHHMTTIEGGMVVTNDSGLADTMRMMRAHGWSRASAHRQVYEQQAPSLNPDFFFTTTGFNLRSTEINAVIGRIQLRKLDAFNARRKQIASYWNEKVTKVDFMRPMETTQLTEVSPFGYPVMCHSEHVRDRLRSSLNGASIETRPIVASNIKRHPAMYGVPHKSPVPLTGADQITDQGLMWPLHPLLTDAEVEYIVDTVIGRTS